MGRVTFSNELNDFVKAFGVGSEIVQNAQDSALRQRKVDIDQQEANDRQAHYQQLGRHYAAEDARLAKDGQSAVDPALKEEWRPPGQLGSFDNSVSRVLGFEGGKGVDTNGAAVNHGINAAANPDVDVNHLSQPQAIGIYKDRYWDAIGGDRLAQINPALAHVAFDTAVNSGPAKAKELIAQSGGDPQKLLALREQFLHSLAQRRPNEFGPNVRKAWDQRIAGLRHDIGVPTYAEGGMVEQKPYYIDDLADDIGGALSSIGEVVSSGLKGLQERFGLNEQPAVADASPDYQNRVMALARNDGAPPPEQIEQAKKVVNPRGELDDSLATTYAMVKSYQHHLAKGDVKSAQQAAAAFILYSKERAQKLGALATVALQNGDETAGRQALMHAFNLAPNGQKVTIDGNKAIVVDQASGKPIKEIELNPEFMLKAAMGLADGSAYMQNLMEVAGAGKAGVSDDEFEQRRSAIYAGAAPSAPTPAAAPPTADAQPAQALPTPAPGGFSEAPPSVPNYRGLDAGQSKGLQEEYRAAVGEYKQRRNDAVQHQREVERMGLETRKPHSFDLKNPENLTAVDEALGWTPETTPKDAALRDGVRSLVGSLATYNPGLSLPAATTALAVLMHVPKDEKDRPFTIEKGDEAYGTVRFKFKDTRLPPVSVPKDELDVLVAMRGLVVQKMAAQDAKTAKQEKARSDLYSW